MSYFTVCTPTYNRAHLLHRPFQSLMKQTFKDFEWLVIDDGSIDETESVVRGFAEEADFSIRYIKQENSGRAAALNTSYLYANSQYIVNIDSDDAFTEDALQIFYDAWESISEQEYDRFWCVTAHCADSTTGKQIGPDWPAGINELSGRKQHRTITLHKGGEKHCCRKTEVLKRFQFPKFEDTKFVPENMVWERINARYDQYCINEVVSIYYTDTADALSRSNHKLSTKHSYYHCAVFYINECFSQIIYNKYAARALLDVSRLAYVTGRKYNTVMRDLNRWYKRLLVSLAWPAVQAFSRYYYKNKTFT